MVMRSASNMPIPMGWIPSTRPCTGTGTMEVNADGVNRKATAFHPKAHDWYPAERKCKATLRSDCPVLASHCSHVVAELDGTDRGSRVWDLEYNNHGSRPK